MIYVRFHNEKLYTQTKVIILSCVPAGDHNDFEWIKIDIDFKHHN